MAEELKTVHQQRVAEITEQLNNGAFEAINAQHAIMWLLSIIEARTPVATGEVAALRAALKSLAAAADHALTTPGMVRGRSQLANAVESARAVLGREG